jgi:hypothetical protein
MKRNLLFDTYSLPIKRHLITELLLAIFLFTPFISYFTFGVLFKENAIYYLQILFNFYSIIFIAYFNIKDFYFPKYLYFLIFYILFILIWSFFNGNFERKGLLFSEFREQVSTFLIILLISNIKFSDIFIHYSIKIIKLTLYLATIVSIIQFLNPSFLDASHLYKYKNFENPQLEFNTIYEVRRLSIFGYTDLNELGLSFLPLMTVLMGYLILNKSKIYFDYFQVLLISALSNTRYVMVGALIIFFSYLRSLKLNLMGYLKYYLILLISLIVLLFFLQLLGYNVWDWFYLRLFPEQTVTKTTRYGALENFLIFFPKVALFGTGVHLTPEIALASVFVGSSQIHVGFLSHLVSYGLFGSFLLFGFWFSLLKSFYKTAKITNYWGSFFALIIFLWANTTLVMYSIYYYGIIIAIIFDKYFKDKSLSQQNL